MPPDHGLQSIITQYKKKNVIEKLEAMGKNIQ